MKITKLKLVCCLTLAVIVAAYADEGNNYTKYNPQSSNAGGCPSYCTITGTISMPCDGSSTSACSPVPPSNSTWSGSCTWVPARGKNPGHYSCN